MKEKPFELTEDIIDCVLGAHVFFNDIGKVALWFRIPNPMLGHMKPIDMIRFGRAKKLRKIINASLDENKDDTFKLSEKCSPDNDPKGAA